LIKVPQTLHPSPMNQKGLISPDLSSTSVVDEREKE
jgi:hypothetical protein